MLEKRARLSEISLNVHQLHLVPLDHPFYYNKNNKKHWLKDDEKLHVELYLQRVFLSNHTLTLFRFVLNSLTLEIT